VDHSSRSAKLRDLLTEYGVPAPAVAALATLNKGRTGCWPDYQDIISRPFADYLALEQAATEIAIYHPEQVPDLLQEPGYAQVIPPSIDRDQRVKLTLARQQAVLGEHRPALTAVIGERALDFVADDIRRDQARHLAALAGTSRQVTIQVLPYTDAAWAVCRGPLTIFRFAGAFTAVHVATLSGGTFLTAVDDTDAEETAFARLQQAALTRDQTRDLLRKLSHT
jgi:hypothetical protein